MALYEVLRGGIKIGGLLYKKGDTVELIGEDEDFFTKVKKEKVKKAGMGSKATERKPSASSKTVAKSFLKKGGERK